MKNPQNKKSPRYLSAVRYIATREQDQRIRFRAHEVNAAMAALVAHCFELDLREVEGDLKAARPRLKQWSQVKRGQSVVLPEGTCTFGGLSKQRNDWVAYVTNADGAIIEVPIGKNNRGEVQVL